MEKSKKIEDIDEMLSGEEVLMVKGTDFPKKGLILTLKGGDEIKLVSDSNKNIHFIKE